MELNYYDFLDVPYSASLSEIEASFTKLAFQYHPDNLPPEKKERYSYLSGKNAVKGLTDKEASEFSKLDEMFKTLVTARDTLSDSNKRQEYDESLMGDEVINSEAFLQSVKAGRLDDVKEQYANCGHFAPFLLNAKQEDDFTALHYAADEGHFEIVKFLVGKGADMNAKTQKLGRKPAHFAAFSGHRSIVEFFVKQDFRVDDRDAQQKTMLHLASAGGHLDIVKFLFQSKASMILSTELFGVMPIHFAAWYGHQSVVEYFLENGQEVDCKTNNHSSTPLHFAANQGQLEMTRFLVQKGAKIRIRNVDGDMPFHVAAEAGHADIVKFYLDQKIEIDNRNRDGHAALHLAVKNNKSDAVKVLLEYGSDVDMVDDNNLKAIHLAARSGHSGVLKLLIEAGAKVHKLGDGAWTALHYAADGGHLLATRVLVESGARTNARCLEGNTALHYAALKGHIEVMKYLIDKDEDIVKIKNNLGLTPLRMVIIEAQDESTEFLRKIGAPTK